MNTYTYRNINEADYHFIRRMFIEVLSDTDPHIAVGNESSVNDFKGKVEGIIAELTDYAPIGSAWVQLTSSIPTMFIFVLPQFRNHGIGKQLLSNLYAMLAAKGISEISLSVHFQNTVAIDLYNKQGWEITGKDSEYIQMKRKLTDS